MSSTLPSSRSALLRLPSTVLALHLDSFHLHHTGSRAERVDRLWAHLQGISLSSTLPSETGSSTNEGSDSESVDASTSADATSDCPDSESADVSSNDESISPSLSRSRSRSRSSHRSRTRSRRSHCSRSHRSRGKHSHRTNRHSRGHRHRSPSSSTDSSSSSSRSSSHSSHVKRRPHRRSSSGHRSHRSNRHHRHSDSQLTSPNGVPLSRSLRRKIRRGEFIDFSVLLGNTLVAGGERLTSHSRRKPLAPISSLESWLQAWSIFAEVLSAAKPHLASHLFKYQAFIVRSSQRFHQHAWLQYDMQFRLKLAANPSGLWSTMDTELVATWLSADATKSKKACFSCGSSAHFAPDCPFRYSGASDSSQRCAVCKKWGHIARSCPLLPSYSSRPASSGDPPSSLPASKPRPSGSGLPYHKSSEGTSNEPCLQWNRNGWCKRGAKCPYRHACLQCNGPHTQRDCPQQPR